MLLLAAPLVLASMQAAANPAAPTTIATKSSRQQVFDAATKAADDRQCAEAVRLFESLEVNRPSKPSPAVDAVIAIRKGICLARLGRAEMAEAALRSGLAVLEPQVEKFRGDVYQAYMMLGRSALLRFDYATAEQEASRALQLVSGRDRVDALLLLTQITMFDGGSKALGHADEAIVLLEAATPVEKDAKDSMAIARTARGRVLLNQRRYAEGYAELRKALDLQGGLGLKVTLSDIVTRSDLAIAAILAGDTGNAKKYLAYSGAGRTKNSPFASGTGMTTPLCAGDAGLRPDDRTIAEFNLNDDGTVSSAVPIYSTGDRQVALQFARAVSEWVWRKDDAVAIPQFFRYAIRVELRCSTVGERPGVMSLLGSRFETWRQARGVSATSREELLRGAVSAETELARARAAGDIARQIVLLSILGRDLNAPAADRRARLAEAAQLAATAATPVPVRTYLALLALQVTDYSVKAIRTQKPAMRALLADPIVAADAASAATLRVMIATPGYRDPAPADADQLLAAVATDARLPADDPLKVNALLQQASRAGAAGNLDAARAAFAKTGLDEEQCALIGVTPQLTRSGASSSDFPSEAMAWGFEGWVRTEFDILADGRTANQRAIIAYPPFVFVDAATGIAKDARFAASYRPSGGTACSGDQRGIAFRLPWLRSGAN